MDEPASVLYVPVRPARLIDAVVVRTCRLREGGRVAFAFTALDRLVAAMGDTQSWIRLSEPALRTMLKPLGVYRIQVDPVSVADDSPAARG
ncbi:SAV_915 family protein [Phytomonospora sp. NPDC050363]|uniref:SAV_915 family protein n=1 Tax=Phytomonospora sp. NPDC050363 TaxID=3155642 RepID=UPI00340E4586